MHAESPFDFNNTPGKLPKEVVPTDYAVRIVPNVEKLNFTGSVTIKVTAKASVKRLMLNALELEIASASVDGKALAKPAIKVDKKQQTLTLDLPAEIPAGEHTLALNFTGKINQSGQGLYYCRYQDQGTGEAKTMLGTQFEATDARRFFPCWDEPAFRARFQLTAVVPENWLAVSNMPVESETKVDGGKEVHFAPTPSMSSYLNVFCAGELDLIETKTAGVQIRVITTKGKAEWGRYALECSSKLLEYYNDYFGIPYPLPKLDQIALPGGFGGAMENWGGITYFESVLLYDSKSSSDRTKHDIFAVVAHEMAHMWFGDLVTMAWWDNLWLNEGFASWMGTKATAHFNPQWDVWMRKNIPRDPTRRVGIAKEQAMEGDARSTTHPIQQPVNTEDEANGAFDDITYQKGSAFLRMLESFLGEDSFRDGIRRYLNEHKYSNSTTADLWRSLGDASEKPVREIATAWTEHPGFPIVRVKRGEDHKVSLSQERFTVNYKNAPSLLWKIPLTYSVNSAAPVSRLMAEQTDELADVPSDAVLKLNVDGAGNYRVEYDQPSWNLLLSSFGKLSLADRVNLLADTWALVQANHASMDVYLGLVERLPGKTDLAERDQLITVLDYINRLLVGSPEREKFQRYARSLLRPTFDALGWESKGEEEDTRLSNLRASVVESLGYLNDPGIIAGCRERFEKYLEQPVSIAPDLQRPVLLVTGRYADEATWNKLHERGLKTTSSEEKQNFYDALARATNPALVKKTLQIALTEELPTSRALYLVGKVARDSDHPELAWEFARDNFKALAAKADAIGALRLAPSLFSFFSDAARADELRTWAKTNLPAGNTRALSQALDEVEFRAEFKPRLARQLNSWIDKK